MQTEQQERFLTPGEFVARYVGNCTTPKPGSLGVAWRCDGFHDTSSHEYGCYMFLPDGEIGATWGACYVPARSLRRVVQS